MTTKQDKVNPIKKELRPLIEEFLAEEDYQDLFFAFAKRVGYKGKDREKAKNVLFTVKDLDIGFNIEGVRELFLEFQLLKQLKDKEPYKTLLEEDPTSITKLRAVAKKALESQDITSSDLRDLFTVDGTV